MANAPDLSWKRYGACRGKPPEWWFPDSELPKYFDDRALVLCETCPVSERCLAYALAYEDVGIWAGTGPKERRTIRRRAGIALQRVQLDPFSVAPLSGRFTEPPDPFEEIA